MFVHFPVILYLCCIKCVCVYVCLILSPSSVPEEHLLEFIERKDHTVVLSALNRFKDSVSVVLPALQVLIPLTQLGKSYY